MARDKRLVRLSEGRRCREEGKRWRRRAGGSSDCKEDIAIQHTRGYLDIGVLQFHPDDRVAKCSFEVGVGGFAVGVQRLIPGVVILGRDVTISRVGRSGFFGGRGGNRVGKEVGGSDSASGDLKASRRRVEIEVNHKGKVYPTAGYVEEFIVSNGVGVISGG
eukprot:755811-Hanusia_phi.AAC.3